MCKTSLGSLALSLKLCYLSASESFTVCLKFEGDFQCSWPIATRETIADQQLKKGIY